MRLRLIAAILGLAAVPQAHAGYVSCRVADPTGTPLNIRVQPAGDVVGALPNGLLVNRAEIATDAKGRAWAFLQDAESGDPIGWVFRDHLRCR